MKERPGLRRTIDTDRGRTNRGKRHHQGGNARRAYALAATAPAPGLLVIAITATNPGAATAADWVLGASMTAAGMLILTLSAAQAALAGRGKNGPAQDSRHPS